MDVTQDTGVSVVTTIIFVIFALEWILNSIVRDTYRFGFAWYANCVRVRVRVRVCRRLWYVLFHALCPHFF